jgi:N-methylhydantoinase B
MEKRVSVLADATLSASMDRTVCPPWGLEGGAPGVPGEGRVQHAERTMSFLRVSGLPLAAGTTVVVSSSGGGGYGPPEERSPLLVARDVREGLVSLDAARDVYRVVLSPSGDVDEPATAALRSAHLGPASGNEP